jgi:hypothetical protein
MMPYEYRTLSFGAVVDITAARVEPDSYLSADQDSIALAKLLAEGFRWVRTDDGHAIFERERPA